MNLFRFPRVSTLVLTAFSALMLGANVSSAQVSRGEFTLPLETHWASAVISPGTYSYTLDRASVGFVLSIRGQGKSMTIPAVGGISISAPFNGSAMLLVTEGRQTTVRSMQFGHLGLTLRYGAPKLDDMSGPGRKESHKSS
jgi:hypothetical protein